MDVDGLLTELQGEERGLSARRRLLQDRIDFVRASGGDDPTTKDQLEYLHRQEREISARRRALHARIARLQDAHSAGSQT